MSLQDLLAAPRPHRAPQCAFIDALNQLGDEHRKLVQAVTEDRRYPHTQITDALREENIHVSRDAVGRHRNGRCACGRSS